MERKKTKYQIFIIDKLKRLREDKEYSQASVAKIIGISPGQMGNIESYKRKHKYTLKHIYSLSQLFEVSIENILSDDGCVIEKGDVNKVLQQIIKYQDDKEENQEY